ncbi:MAG TPA: hypothetical protein VHY33_02730 [Thermoanaerobaculia bacterium]|jgi:hypothetical protein|nr:hypothetical protein [Thermoanaerobaculia bacterium]
MTVAGEWESFYVIVGSSAAALTGLQFVVVALSADTEGLSTGSDVFATPTVVHFCATLLIAAILCVPRQTPASLAACLAAEGLAGMIYVTIVMLRFGKEMHYKPVLEDRIWHIVLPSAAYVALFASGIATYRHEVSALYIVAATALLLLLIGIHNAWDAAVYIAMRKRER